MSTNSHLQLGSVEALVVRKPIKNLHLSVLPPDGRVRVTAPEGMKDDAIRTLLALRLPWIKNQQSKFVGQERQTKREYVSGESHYFLGKRYRLMVVEASMPTRVEIKRNKIVLHVRPNTSTAKREEVMIKWYRRQLYPVIEEMMIRWQKKIGVNAKHWGIKRMKTRWGTCNHETGHILLNLELGKKPIGCIEYVVVHELLHLSEKKHNDRFINLMTRYLPKWRAMKEDLNRFVLSHEKWNH
jgi:predicted metal-dependent hydrolase